MCLKLLKKVISSGHLQKVVTDLYGLLLEDYPMQSKGPAFSMTALFGPMWGQFFGLLKMAKLFVVYFLGFCCSRPKSEC